MVGRNISDNWKRTYANHIASQTLTPPPENHVATLHVDKGGEGGEANLFVHTIRRPIDYMISHVVF